MKIDVVFPWGGEFHMERQPREPMPRERFDQIFWLALAAIISVTICKCWIVLFV